jgi:hypothetical protein
MSRADDLLGKLEDKTFPNRLPGVSQAVALRGELAKAAQKQYDEWDVSDPEDDELNGGGICHLIADEMADVLSKHGIDASTVSSDHEQHVYLVAAFREGVYLIDVPYSTYERGGGYSWTKIPGVEFGPDDVSVERLDSDPGKLADYAGDM